MRHLPLATLAGIVALAFATPAQATAPQRFEFDWQESDSIDCSMFDPNWTFRDDFVDFFHDRGQIWFDADGNPIRSIEHIEHTSNDVNSITGFTLHEHNHFVIQNDFLTRTGTSSGAFNIMQRRGVGEVIHSTGHRLMAFGVDQPLVIDGPEMASDADFCAAIAP